MQDNQVMAKFRLRIEPLALKKSAERGTRITQRVLAEETHVPLTTLSRWSSKTHDRIDADMVLKLQRYFKCSLDELIEVVE